MDESMKKLTILLLALAMLTLCGCSQTASYSIVTTTLPVYELTTNLCAGTDLSIGRLITESVSCLHDYTLQVGQMRMIEDADVVILSGMGLEDFLEDALHGSNIVIDASKDTHTHSSSQTHAHTNHHDHEHVHETDPHIWLSPENAKIMAHNIAAELATLYPEYQEVFLHNMGLLSQKLDDLQEYGTSQLADLESRDMITFHDGFAYFAESFGLHILEAIEEESGSEASAAEIIHLVELVEEYDLPAVFIEKNGSDACASVISAETGAEIYMLDMAMAGDSYFDAIYHNIDTIKEAMG